MAEHTITSPFEVFAWEVLPYDEEPTHARLTRVHVRKRFSGSLDGESDAELLMAEGEGGRGYVASELFEGSLDGRPGTFVLQHGGVDDGEDPYTYGTVVPGTGTDELVGLKGTVVFAHDEEGARLTLTYALPGGS
ncbi:MAG: DUF3224 domain-containing protein [Actinomycetota bacterium]|nr:DUF3224 domain-containing protein [Actinomycetota bacterium]